MIVRRSLVVVAVTMLALAACSDDDGSGGDTTGGASPTSEPSPTEAPSPDETPSASETPAGGGETEIESEESALGLILTDGDGRTLYLFLNDEQGGPSTCADDCAASWPPLLADGEVEVSGNDDDPTDASLVGTIARDDGGTQVTYNGWPLYYFGGDQGPGDTNGQGVGDVWFVLSPEGDAIGG
jgi:predicted lipoprotein with Yx(FWY)xxD motif